MKVRKHGNNHVSTLSFDGYILVEGVIHSIQWYHYPSSGNKILGSRAHQHCTVSLLLDHFFSRDHVNPEQIVFARFNQNVSHGRVILKVHSPFNTSTLKIFDVYAYFSRAKSSKILNYSIFLQKKTCFDLKDGHIYKFSSKYCTYYSSSVEV